MSHIIDEIRTDLGAIAGSLIRRHLRRPPLELVVMAVLLLAATPVRTMANAIPFELGLLAMAMAMQGETVSQIGTVSIQTVVVTNNLLHFADTLVGRFLSAPAATEGQGHSRPTVTEVAIPASPGRAIRSAPAPALSRPLRCAHRSCFQFLLSFYW